MPQHLRDLVRHAAAARENRARLFPSGGEGRIESFIWAAAACFAGAAVPGRGDGNGHPDVPRGSARLCRGGFALLYLLGTTWPVEFARIMETITPPERPDRRTQKDREWFESSK